MPTLPTTSLRLVGSLLLLVAPFIWIRYRTRPPPRRSRVHFRKERVLVLGASSGIGRSIAHLYAKRGARVFLVARNLDGLRLVREECLAKSPIKAPQSTHQISQLVGDFTVPDDMVAVRNAIERDWGGLDTLVVAAGVSALKPLLSIGGELDMNLEFRDRMRKSLRKTLNVSDAVFAANYGGPLTAALTFLPIMLTGSAAPAVMLISSLASVIPPPTRSLYASSKGAALLLYQALSMEHPDCQFTTILPSTVKGNFRESAVDRGEVVEIDPNDAKSGALTPEEVARRSVAAVDAGERRVFMPRHMRIAHLLYWVYPSLIERLAKKKYNYKPAA